MLCKPQNQSVITTESTLIYPQGITQSNSLLSLSSQSRKAVLLGTLLILGLISLFSCKGVSADMGIDARQAIKAIVGEAEGEPYLGKVAIGEALRNRNSLKGVYGLNSKRLGLASPSVWKDAEKAWMESVGSNLTKGADVWGSKADVRIFKRQAWFKSYEHTATIGNHLFFRRVK